MIIWQKLFLKISWILVPSWDFLLTWQFSAFFVHYLKICNSYFVFFTRRNHCEPEVSRDRLNLNDWSVLEEKELPSWDQIWSAIFALKYGSGVWYRYSLLWCSLLRKVAVLPLRCCINMEELNLGDLVRSTVWQVRRLKTIADSWSVSKKSPLSSRPVHTPTF